MDGKGKNKMVKNGDFEPYRENVHSEFVRWFAMPSSERARTGAETMAQFAEKHGVHPNTLTRWRRAEGFMNGVYDIRKSWGDDMTAYVFDGWKLACMKGDSKAIELWMAYFEGFNKNKVVTHQNVELTENDIRQIIHELPAEDQKEFYRYLQLLHDRVRYYLRENERKQKEQAAAEAEAKKHWLS